MNAAWSAFASFWGKRYARYQNTYADARLEPIKPLVDELAAELTAREAQQDATVPTAYVGYLYERRFGPGAQYPSIVRRKDEHGAQEEIVLNVAEFAAGHHPRVQFMFCYNVQMVVN